MTVTIGMLRDCPDSDRARRRAAGNARARPVQSILLAAGASMKVTLIPVT
ncbi:MBL fold metallo-hydrolase, partial [Bacillus sp. AFS075960]